MNNSSLVSSFQITQRKTIISAGIVTHLFLFPWTLAMIFLAPSERIIWVGLFCVLISRVIYPVSLRRLFCLRNLILISCFVLPPIFWGKPDHHIFFIPISDYGIQLAIQMSVRAFTIMVIVSGFTAVIDIAKLMGFFDRVGLNGLGFSMGVALHMFPAIKKMSINTWNSLKMRGGLRHKKRQTIQLLIITIITNALRYAENVTLAAEARAFNPSNRHFVPLKINLFDYIFVFILLLIFLFFNLL
jgi:energy-coupling factor transporter transmembrane protein EcfT